MAHQLTGPAITTIANTTSQAGPQSSTQSIDNSIPELQPADAYAVFLRHLDSVSLRQRFFKSIYLPAHPSVNEKDQGAREALWKHLNANLSIETGKTVATHDLVKVTFDSTNPEHASDWVNQYIQMAIKASQDQLLAGLKGAIDLRLGSVQDQISTLRQIALTNRQDEIARLKNALSLARAINLETPPTTGNLITSYTGSTAYLRGTKALQAELALLEKRSSDDPYIPELPTLLKEKALLAKVDLNPHHLSVVTIDQTATPPQSPVRPRKKLIIFLSIIFGIILGTVIALIRQLWTRPDTRTSEANNQDHS